MKEIKIYARAGQGAITTASILGQALFLKGKYAYAFPHFGAARMGAPMNAFVRVDDRPIRLRSQIYEPDYIIIVDSTLMRGFDCFAGLKPDGVAVVNEREGMEVPKVKGKQKIVIVPANKIAQEVIGRPLGNTTLIGAFAAATKEIDLVAISEAIKERFQGKIADLNIEAAKRGYDFIKQKG
jgi:pyruvate ferredoxin oxidoreductase gamma subunit